MSFPLPSLFTPAHGLPAAELAWSGHWVVCVCLFLNLAVVKGNSASWVELMDARECLISVGFWQLALALMFAMAH